jgi:hypothetical protein
MMKINAIALFSLAMVSCIGPAGQSYLKYDWINTPLSFSDTNPDTPYSIVKNQYFATEEGRFYIEYEASNGSDHYAYYTIENAPGEILIEGSERYYEITLFDLGPTLYLWSYPRKLESEEKGMVGDKDLDLQHSSADTPKDPY